MKLNIREKYLSIMLVCKDIYKTIIDVFCITILLCVVVDNGWFVPLIDVYNITSKEFWEMFRCFLLLIPVITFYRALTGKYTVIIEEHTADNKYGIAKRQKFRIIK